MNNQKSTDEWIEIGTIVAPQGIKGEVRINPSSDFPERFEQPGKRWLKSPKNSIPEAIELLEGYQIPGKNLYVVKLQGIDDRSQAENLRGYKLLVPSSDRPQLEEDEYHVNDLINLEVYNQFTGENIGKIIDVYFAGNDLLEVELHQQPMRDIDKLETETKKDKKIKPVTVLIPFVKDIVPIIDLENGKIEITPPPGLLEINQT